jgi:kynurenine formamidase
VEYFNGMHPFLTGGAAEFLVEAGVALVGIDSYNIDDISGGARPAHTLLLAAQIPIVEHLCGLGELPDDGYHFFAVPPPISGMGSFPVRAFALID